VVNEFACQQPLECSSDPYLRNTFLNDICLHVCVCACTPAVHSPQRSAVEIEHSQTSLSAVWSSGVAEEQEREDTWEGDQKHMLYNPCSVSFTTNTISDSLETVKLNLKKHNIFLTISSIPSKKTKRPLWL